MIISIIVAIGKNNVIGKGNNLPWRLSSDLKYFKQITLGHTVIMGNNTFKSIGKPLSGRKNIVISRSISLVEEKDFCIVNSVENAIKKVEDDKEAEAFIIGGESIYKQAINIADKLYVTEVDAVIDGDKFFPNIDRKIWKEIGKVKGQKTEKDDYNFNFLIYERQTN